MCIVDYMEHMECYQAVFVYCRLHGAHGMLPGCVCVLQITLSITRLCLCIVDYMEHMECYQAVFVYCRLHGAHGMLPGCVCVL